MLKIFAKFVICFLRFNFSSQRYLPKAKLIHVCNAYLYVYVSHIVLVYLCKLFYTSYSVFTITCTIACPTVAIRSLFSIRHFAVDTCTPKHTYFLWIAEILVKITSICSERASPYYHMFTQIWPYHAHLYVSPLAAYCAADIIKSSLTNL